MRTRRIATRTPRALAGTGAGGVGMMHGLAGSAALVVLGDAVNAVGGRWGVGYIALFGLGSIAGMAVLSVAIAVPLQALTRTTSPGMHRAMTAGVGVFSCVLGVAMVVEIGYLKALLA